MAKQAGGAPTGSVPKGKYNVPAGAKVPSTDGPSSSPVAISPMTRGCPKRSARLPRTWDTATITTMASRTLSMGGIEVWRADSATRAPPPVDDVRTMAMDTPTGTRTNKR